MIKVSDHAFGRLANLALGAIHVKLPFQMLVQRRRLSEKLFEGRCVFLVLKFLSLVTGIEVILKLAAEINFFESVARSFRGKFLTCFQARSLGVGVGGELGFTVRQKPFGFALTRTVGRRCAELRRRGFDIERRKILDLTTTGHVVEDLLGHLLRFFLRGDFFEDGILVKLLLDQVGQLERSHLQHLDPLPQLRR